VTRKYAMTIFSLFVLYQTLLYLCCTKTFKFRYRTELDFYTSPQIKLNRKIPLPTKNKTVPRRSCTIKGMWL